MSDPESGLSAKSLTLPVSGVYNDLSVGVRMEFNLPSAVSAPFNCGVAEPGGILYL